MQDRPDVLGSQFAIGMEHMAHDMQRRKDTPMFDYSSLDALLHLTAMLLFDR